MKIEFLITLQNWILKIGVWVSVALVFVGGGIYLFYHGFQPQIDFATIAKNQPVVSELKIVKYGIYTLILTQFVRLLFVCIIFFIKRNFLLFLISTFVLGFIIFAMSVPFLMSNFFNKI